MSKLSMSCADCAVQGCKKPGSAHPQFCVSDGIDAGAVTETLGLYEDPENRAIMEAAAQVEAEFYGVYSRVQELLEFAHRMGYKRIGIATCISLAKETRILSKILRDAGFEVVAAACKVTETPKESLGLPSSPKAGSVACNPIMQARLMNEAQCDLNVIMGLCLGHDVLFTKYSEAPVTTLVVKDRVTVNNPCAALYAADGMYEKRLAAQIAGYQE